MSIVQEIWIVAAAVASGDHPLASRHQPPRWHKPPAQGPADGRIDREKVVWLDRVGVLSEEIAERYVHVPTVVILPAKCSNHGLI